MLIDFTVENYRSIKEPVTLSAVAQRHGANEQDNKIAEPFSYPARKLEILPVLGIFGANASGKSNVINALDQLISFLYYNDFRSISGHKAIKLFSPFKLDSTSKASTNFEMKVLLSGEIYTYQLSVNQHQILHERLTYVPKISKISSARLLFSRKWNGNTENYEIKNGNDFGESYRELQSSLKESQSFLALAVKNLNNKRLRSLTQWIWWYWKSVSLNEQLFDFTAACKFLCGHLSIVDSGDLKDKVKILLKKFDTDIEDFKIKEKQESNGEEAFEVWVIHKKKKKNAEWLLEEESLGTQKLFLLATKLFFTFSVGGIMLVDELGFGTHPKINQEMVSLFQDKRINKNHAQLVFTSHDATLLRKGLLRRDQIWFTQKREDGSTELYPLSDFGVRNDLLIDRAYLDGRFGAVPFLPDKEELTELLGV